MLKPFLQRFHWKKHSHVYSLIILVLYSLLFLALNIKMNLFSYSNFDFGKFDLGNMAQMAWNTLHGRFMYLTDYFGTNMPRWGMSHVDPILVIFLPIFALIQSPLTLVFSQVILLTFTSILIYLFARFVLKSDLAGLLFGLAFLFYPAVGYLSSRTGYHGVTPALTFFLLAFYIYERYLESDVTPSRVAFVTFWISLILAMMGKEQISLYLVFYGLFLFLFRSKSRLGVSVSLVGLIWFVLAFFVIIPAFAHYRIEGYKRFALSLHMDVSEESSQVTKSNYFLSRYSDFGDSYGEVALNMLKHPAKSVRVFFSGDKPENFRETFVPLGFLPFVSPATLMIALPDFGINYLTTGGGVGTSEIYNHRISMIIPVLFISTIYAVAWLSEVISSRTKFARVYVVSFLALLVLCLNIYTSFAYENPVYLWARQAVQRRVVARVFARTVSSKTSALTVSVGERADLPALHDKDRECAQRVVPLIPEGVSVSGPDYLGAHLGLRETYAIFPALYDEADIVIVDVFARKLNRILNIPEDIVGFAVGRLLQDPNYRLVFGCGNLFVYANIGEHPKDTRLPVQERFEFDPVVDFELINSLHVVDYSFPSQAVRGTAFPLQTSYQRHSGASLNGFVLYTSFVNVSTRELYQVANPATLSISKPDSWDKGVTYITTQEIILPEFLPAGKYRVFSSLTNKIRTRNIYLGSIEVK